ncbi:MAG: hypothetical protein WAM91_15265 [Candidatus Acidiferrales bacterium]
MLDRLVTIATAAPFAIVITFLASTLSNVIRTFGHPTRFTFWVVPLDSYIPSLLVNRNAACMVGVCRFLRQRSIQLSSVHQNALRQPSQGEKVSHQLTAHRPAARHSPVR